MRVWFSGVPGGMRIVTVKSSGDLSSAKANQAKSIAERSRDGDYSEPQPEQGASPASWTRLEMDAAVEAIDPAELQEFLETDWTHIQADPEFKERLRAELWRMVSGLPKAKKEE